MNKRLRLLMIEDSETDATLLQAALSNAGYDVACTVVDTPAGMRAALERPEWDVITSDHSMPHFSASAALEIAHQLLPELPFIIVSGEIDLGLAVSLMKQGAQDYIQKWDMARLVPAIEREVSEGERRREREAALKISEARYRRHFETALDGILIVNMATGEIAGVNPFLKQMLGYTRDDVVGKKLWELRAFRDPLAPANAFAELQRNGYVRYEDLILQTSDGKFVNVEFVSNVYHVNDKYVAQCNLRDITARKRAEAELRSLNTELKESARENAAQLDGVIKELKAFSYSVSHDLRTPLRHIMGFANILRHSYPSKDAAKDDAAKDDAAKDLNLIETICVSAQRMNDLIDALLRLARLSGGEFRRRPVDLSAASHRIAAELQRSDANRTVRFSIAEGITAMGDDQLLSIALENLLSNAWKFTSTRAAAHIELGAESQADGSKAYFVRDNGAGFDGKYADRMFGVFQRLHSEKEFPGIGIGLATVKRIVDRHGGQVWAKGIVDEGATLYFSLGEDHPSIEREPLSSAAAL